MYVRKKPKLSWKPLTSMRWRFENNPKMRAGWEGTTLHPVYGRRYFIFGILPVWSVKEGTTSPQEASNG